MSAALSIDPVRTCRRCRVELTRKNAHVPSDLRAVGYGWSDLEVCDRCRPSDDEAYGLAISRAAAR